MEKNNHSILHHLARSRRRSKCNCDRTGTITWWEPVKAERTLCLTSPHFFSLRVWRYVLYATGAQSKCGEGNAGARSGCSGVLSWTAAGLRGSRGIPGKGKDGRREARFTYQGQARGCSWQVLPGAWNSPARSVGSLVWRGRFPVAGIPRSFKNPSHALSWFPS